jgi:hypothetical protein
MVFEYYIEIIETHERGRLMPTISAYTTEKLRRRIERIVREEGRKQAQVGSTALELYAALPAAARRAFLELLAAEEELHPGILERAIEDMSRALLNAKWELTTRRISAHVAEHGGVAETELSEDEIEKMAVGLTRRPRAGKGK